MTSARTLLLVRHRWVDANPAAALRDARVAGVDAEVFRSEDGGEGYAYLASASGGDLPPQLEDRIRQLFPGATLARLELIMTLAGASANEEAPIRYVVETDVQPEHEAEFNAWYDDEHLAGLASVPGNVRASRYRDGTGHPRYHACYDLVQRETLGSPAWLAVRATPWSDRVRPTFVNTKRTLFRRVASATTGNFFRPSHENRLR